MSIQDVFKILRKRIMLIIASTVLVVTLVGLISFLLLTPIYQASTQILVNKEREDTAVFTAQDIQTNVQLINTYKVIIESAAILEIVKEELDLEESSEEIKSKLNISSEQNSQVVTITVDDPDPLQAVNIANTTAEVFQVEVIDLMNVDNVRILASANLGEEPKPIKPNPLINMFFGAAAGFLVGIALAFLLELLDTSVKSTKEVEDITGYPVIGMIATISDKELKSTRLQLTNRRRGIQ